MLITHPKFFDRKQLDSVITEVCKNIDRQLCKMLRESDDESGSTGVIAIYDGRRHLFTVAGELLDSRHSYMYVSLSE